MVTFIARVAEAAPVIDSRADDVRQKEDEENDKEEEKEGEEDGKEEDEVD